MLSVSRTTKIFLYGAPADLRRGYDGLAAIVQDTMEEALERIAGGCATAAEKHESTVGSAIHYNEVVATGLTSVSDTAGLTAFWDFE